MTDQRSLPPKGYATNSAFIAAVEAAKRRPPGFRHTETMTVAAPRERRGPRRLTVHFGNRPLRSGSRAAHFDGRTVASLGRTVASLSRTVHSHGRTVASLGRAVASLGRTVASHGRTVHSASRTMASAYSTLTLIPSLRPLSSTTTI